MRISAVNSQENALRAWEARVGRGEQARGQDPRLSKYEGADYRTPNHCFGIKMLYSISCRRGTLHVLGNFCWDPIEYSCLRGRAFAMYDALPDHKSLHTYSQRLSVYIAFIVGWFVLGNTGYLSNTSPFTTSRQTEGNEGF
jgi:hypothetical protein